MEEKKEKNPEDNLSEEDRFFFGNLKDIQIITMFAGSSAVVLTLILTILIPEQIDRTLIFYTLIGISIFLVFYLSTPFLYLNPRFTYWPDTVFVISITLIMYALRGYSDFYFILFIVLVAVDAFALRLRHFIFIVCLMLASILFYNLVMTREFYSGNMILIRTMIQTYSILVTATVMRFFSSKALSEKEEKEKIRRLAKNTLSAIKNLRTLLDNIGDGVFAVDENQKVYTSNTAAIKSIGWNKPIANKKIQEIMPLKDADLDDTDPVREVLEKGKPFVSNEIVMLKEEEQIKLYINIAPVVDDDGKVQGAIIVFRDITKEKELEEQRLEFVAVSSHELRTPLTIMEGYLYHILKSNKLKYDDETKKYIEKAHKSATSLQRLIKDLLDVSKLDQNKMDLSFEKTDLSEIAKETISELSKSAKEKGLKLKLKIKQKRIPKILTDSQRIKEVFVNLITNALKFTERGEIVIGIEKLKNKIQMSVSDNGIGISEEDQRLIFNKFYRAESWRTKRTSGTGLGLYIARQVVEKHGGKIWAKSKFDKGSTFYFNLPLPKPRKRKSTVSSKNKKTKNKELGELVKKL